MAHRRKCYEHQKVDPLECLTREIRQESCPLRIFKAMARAVANASLSVWAARSNDSAMSFRCECGSATRMLGWREARSYRRHCDFFTRIGASDSASIFGVISIPAIARH